MRKLIAFSTSSLLGTAVDMIVLWICSHYLFDGYFHEYILSPFISFEFAILTNFSVAYFLIWRERVTRHSAGSFFRHLCAYNLSSFGVFLVKLGMIQAIHFIFPGMDVLICNLLALCVSGGINFVLNEWVIFRKKEVREIIDDDTV